MDEKKQGPRIASGHLLHVGIVNKGRLLFLFLKQLYMVRYSGESWKEDFKADSTPPYFRLSKDGLTCLSYAVIFKTDRLIFTERKKSIF